MNKEIKAKWVEALRSGKYKQGKSRLRTRTGYCCLGVLCSVLKARNWADGSAALPRLVQQQAGLSSGLPEIKYKGETTHLAYLNDGEGLDFNQIADLIEAQL